MPPTEAEVRELVRGVLTRLLERTAGAPSPQGSRATRVLIDEATVRDLAPGATLSVPTGALVTPLARQVALERNITLSEAGSAPVTGSTARAKSAATQRVALGADHGGFHLKEALKPFLQSLGYEVVDCGTTSTDSVDYPDFAYAVAQLVASGQCANGIIVDGAGIGSCIVANKVPGVRAALCYDHATAVNSREHNHANVLTLGAGLIGINLAKQIAQAWLATAHGGGRHAARVAKITAIEKRFSR